jgi:hypothetical protein
MTEVKAFRTFIRIYSLFKSECLSTNIKLTLHKALIRPVMTYACPAWKLVADTYHLDHVYAGDKLWNDSFSSIFIPSHL